MKNKFLKVRENTLDICAGFSEEELSFQPRTEVSPVKWHLGHTTWFFEKIILEKYIENFLPFKKDFNYVFNSYYKQVGEHINQCDRGEIKINSREVLAYRKFIDEKIVFLLNSTVDKKVIELIEIGLNHEEQHQELLHMDIKAVLFSFNKEYSFKPELQIEKATGWLSISEGIIECGNDSDGFCYDNEKPLHKYYQYSTSVSQSLVSNAEFSEFIKGGGYSNSKYWLSKGWEWIEENRFSRPLYWNDSLDPLMPVAHVSYYEADAYANWAGYRLPTEFEHEYFDKVNNKNNLLWSWTSTQYGAYPGFQKFDGKLSEYNGKFMCNQFVLRGGCIATPHNHWRPSYRNFYEPNQRWMYSGIRLAKDGHL